MPATFEPIQSYTLVSAGMTTFSSIPQTYTDLFLCIDANANPAQNVNVQFNGDTTNAYSGAYMTGNGSTATSGQFINQTAGCLVGQVYNGRGTVLININSYAVTGIFKTALGQAGNGVDSVSINCGVWRNTAPITSVKVNSTFDAGSVLTLYGIKAA
jgi:hypothetical protein